MTKALSRWRDMVRQLRGQALPPLPTLPGRRHICAAHAADDEDRDDILRSQLGVREAAKLLDLPVREVQRQRARARETGET